MISSGEKADILRSVRIALTGEPELDLSVHPVAIKLSHGDLVLEGELPSLAVKKRALVRAAAVTDVPVIVDRLRIAPARRMTNAEIRDSVCHALLQELAFGECVIRARLKGRSELVRGTTGAPADRSSAPSRPAW